ncbi:MAG: PepSY domain-containing protein [Steroidobacteraceae bacterium]
MGQAATATRARRFWSGSLLPAWVLMLVALSAQVHGAERIGRDTDPPPAQGIREGVREPARFAPVGVSLDHVISQVEKRHKARVVRVEQVHVNGRLVYKLRMLSEKESRVWVVSVDAESGAEI